MGESFKKAPKLIYSAVHPGNNKQNLTLALTIFHETTSDALKRYFPDWIVAANVLSLFHKLLIVCNSKSHLNSSSRLGNAAVPDDNKPEFFSHFPDWVEPWFECPYFMLTKIRDTLEGDYNFVQNNLLERYFSKYRQMSGGRFLVSLREVNNSEKILKMSIFLKNIMNFGDENVYINNNISELVEQISWVLTQQKS